MVNGMSHHFGDFCFDLFQRVHVVKLQGFKHLFNARCVKQGLSDFYNKFKRRDDFDLVREFSDLDLLAVSAQQ